MYRFSLILSKVLSVFSLAWMAVSFLSGTLIVSAACTNNNCGTLVYDPMTHEFTCEEFGFPNGCLLANCECKKTERKRQDGTIEISCECTPT
jgi:hypothetical protein